MRSGFHVSAIAVLLVFFAASTVVSQAPDLQKRASEIFIAANNDYSAGRYDAAISKYTEYIKIRPDYHGAWFNRGMCYYYKAEKNLNRPDFESADADLSKAIELDRTKADYWLYRGFVYLRLIPIDYKGYTARSIADFSQAIKLDPKLQAAYTGRAQAYEKSGQDVKAIADATKALQLSKTDYVALYTRAKAYSFQKKYAAAKKDLEEAIRLYPDYSFAKSLLADVNSEAQKLQATVAAKPPVSQRPTVTSKPPVVTKPVETPIADAREGYTRADAAEKAGDHRKVIDIVTKSLPLITMRSDGVPANDIDTFVYLDLVKKRARAYNALKLYKEGDEAFKRTTLDAVANMNVFLAKANEEFKKDTGGSGAGALMAGMQTGQSNIVCKSTFDSVTEWIDAVNRDRPNDLNARLSGTVLMVTIREMCALSYYMDGSIEHSRINTYTGNSIKTKQLNTAIERYTEAINYLKVYRPAYEARAKAYRELGRADLAIADEQKAATLPVR